MPYAHQQNGKVECSMCTLLDMAHTMLADSGLPQKYWADAVQTGVYMRNFIPLTHNPSAILAERWEHHQQDISHLCPFGSTAYAHIPVEISPSKLSPCSVKLTLVGYYNHTSYKLLDCATGVAYKSHNIIFEESKPHLSTDPIVTYPADDSIIATSDVIMPHPKHISTLHLPKSAASTLPGTMLTPNVPTLPAAPAIVSKDTGSGDDALDSEVEVSRLPIDDSIMAQRSRPEMKLMNWMKESLEYLGQAQAHVAFMDREMDIPKAFYKAMKRPDLWFAPMVKELQMMKNKEVYCLVSQPADKNVAKSQWVSANKYNDAGNISAHKAHLVFFFFKNQSFIYQCLNAVQL
jgi:hypothetical protein